MVNLILWFCVLWIVYTVVLDEIMARQGRRSDAQDQARLTAESAANAARWKDEQYADALRMDADAQDLARRVVEANANAARWMDATRAACGSCHGTGRLADDIPCPGCTG